MTDLLSTVLAPLKSARDTVKGLMEIRDTVKFGKAIIELQTQIVAAQKGVSMAQEHEAEMAEEIRGLKEQVAKFEEWETEKKRYKLTELPPGVFVYSLKTDMQDSEPMHSICEKCYQNGKKSILHSQGKWNGMDSLKCYSCGVEISTGHRTEPQVISDYDPLNH